MSHCSRCTIAKREANPTSNGEREKSRGVREGTKLGQGLEWCDRTGSMSRCGLVLPNLLPCLRKLRSPAPDRVHERAALLDDNLIFMVRLRRGSSFVVVDGHNIVGTLNFTIVSASRRQRHGCNCESHHPTLPRDTGPSKEHTSRISSLYADALRGDASRETPHMTQTSTPHEIVAQPT